MESIYKLGIILSVLDKVTGPSTRIGQSLRGVKAEASSLGPVFDKFKTYGLQVATFGAIMLHVLGGMAAAAIPVQKAMGELASVGVQELAAVAEAGRTFTNQWAGTNQAQFVAAAYDIKSGISSLTDTGVAEFTRLAALTGKATKSTTAEMTSLFATGYGIYKGYYDRLSDLQFGEMFSAGLAASVQAFKTTGSGMAGAIENLGATATTAKVPLEEQLAILGMLQATMSGSEAGTRYRAMLQAAGQAGQKLNLQFMDANNQLLSMPEILTALRDKYGDTLDAMEKLEIQKAFGTQEAVMVIDLLYGSVGKLQENITGLSGAMQKGTSFTEQMAAAMNQDLGSGLGLLSQQFNNLKIIVGNQLTPVLLPLFTTIGNGIIWLQDFATRHKTLTRVLVVSLAVIASAAFVLGTLATALGVIGLLWPNISAGWAALTTAAGVLKSGILTLVPAVWSFTAALLANPITWVVIAIVALVAGLVWLYKHLDAVRDLFGQLKTVLRAMGAAFVEAFKYIVQWLSNLDLFEAGKKLLLTLVSGINSVITAPYNAVKGAFSKITNLLNHSDAKEGPLSSLTLNGQAIMQTLGADVQAAAPGFRRQVAAALGGAVLATSVAVTPAAPAAVPMRGPAEAPARKAASKTYKIHIERIELPQVSDGRSFIRELEHLVEGCDG